MGNGDASMRRAAVGLVRCAGYEEYAAVRAAVRESFDLFGGIAALVRPGQRVLLKPNLLSALPAEAGVNTHPSVVRAVAEEALEAGGVLSIGDSPAFSRLDDTCAACGLDQVARELGIPIVPFNRPVWVPTRVPHGPARGFKVDRAVLTALCDLFGGGPVGLSTLAIAVAEPTETVEDVYEPFLIQQGLLMRTPRGRVATPAAWRHIGLVPPPSASASAADPSLFD